MFHVEQSIWVAFSFQQFVDVRTHVALLIHKSIQMPTYVRFSFYPFGHAHEWPMHRITNAMAMAMATKGEDRLPTFPHVYNKYAPQSSAKRQKDSSGEGRKGMPSKLPRGPTQVRALNNCESGGDPISQSTRARLAQSSRWRP